MEKFKREIMSIKLSCVCVSYRYFEKHFSKYYELLSYDVVKSKEHGPYMKVFYKLKSFDFFIKSNIDKDIYYELPYFICASKIY